MKTTLGLITIIAGFLLATSIQSFAIVGLDIEKQGTNIVISWPSLGYEHYLIQYRPTLDPGTPWENLTNNYPANSTNRTTFTLYGVVPPPPPPGEGDSMAASGSSSGPMVMWKDGIPMPLNIYPPGFDLSGRIIIWPDGSTEEWTKEFGEKYDANRGGGNGPETDGPVAGDDSGFFRVFHIPDWTFNVTNYTYDGPTFFPVDFKDYMDRVDNIEVLLNGQPTSDAIFTNAVDQGQTNWGMGIYFDFYPSGTNQIQLRSTLRLNDEIGDDTVYLVLSNLMRTIVVDNQVTFTNWDGLIMSSNFTFNAQTKTNNTDWRIDIYDASDNYVNGGSGHTTNGQIQWMWDLTDTNGTPRDDLDGDPFFQSYITFATAAGPQTTRRTPPPQTEYPSVGNWLITFSDNHFNDAGTNYTGGQQYYTNGVYRIAEWIDYRSIPWTVYPIKFGTNSYTQTERNDSWSYLKATLFTPQSRNFYYHGHGSANDIGADIHTFDTNGFVTGGITLPGSKAFLRSQTVSNELVFNRYSGARPYRFVWLDGCSTANGNWPGAFGVDKVPYDLDHYTNSATNPKHRRPSVFVGWNQIVGGKTWGFARDAGNFRWQWMREWSYHWQTTKLTVAFDVALDQSGWVTPGKLWGALRVYGYTNMLMNGYNQKNDWRWP
jgi:hypothetical protein